MNILDKDWRDTGVEIGADFYSYANGGWMASNPLPKEYGSWGSFREVQSKNEDLLRRLLGDISSAKTTHSNMASVYFSSAMDVDFIEENGTKPIDELAKNIYQIGDVSDIKNVLINLHRYGVRSLFSLSFDPDFDDSSKYLVYVNQSGLGLPEKGYYLRQDGASVELQNQYVLHIEKQLFNYGMQKAKASSVAKDIYEFEKKLAEVSFSPERLRDVKLTINRFSIRKISRLMPRFALDKYLQESGINVSSVNIENPQYLMAVDGILSEAPIETTKQYMIWCLIRAYASSLPRRFDQEAFSFYGKRINGQAKQRPRWKRALDWATSDVGDLVARVYVESAFSEEAKQRCQNMVTELLGAMKRSLENNDWMSQETKREALVKLSKFGYKIGYPDVWRDLSGLIISPEVAFATNRMQANLFDFQRRVDRLGEPVDKAEWEMPAHAVNAYYHPLMNEIVFPAGILQPPFFYEDADDAVIYGAIGTVIGHEITHGFDDQGSQFDGDGHYRQWWREADRLEFEKRTRRLVEQFNKYSVLGGKHVNGQLTLGENIADLGGLAIAYDAFLHATKDKKQQIIDGLTPRQRFFLSFATIWRVKHSDEYLETLVNTDPHAPGQFRCNGAVSNTPAFAEAFDLDANFPLVLPLAKRVKIW